MEILRFFEQFRCPALDAVFSVLTCFGEETVFMILALAVFLCRDKYDGYYLLLTGFFGTLASQFLKMLCRIPRPWVRDPSFSAVESAKAGAGGYSFPSGHSQTAVGLFGGAALLSEKRPVRILLIALCLLVPISRMYLGVHTPWDVLVGALLGLLPALALRPVFQKARTHSEVLAAVMIGATALCVLYLVFVTCFPWKEEVLSPENIDNLLHAKKNGFTLTGCIFGLDLTCFLDEKFLHFETKTTPGMAILKLLGGLLLLVVCKVGLSEPMLLLFKGEYAARCVRYFLTVFCVTLVWPLFFRECIQKPLTRKKETA